LDQMWNESVLQVLVIVTMSFFPSNKTLQPRYETVFICSNSVSFILIFLLLGSMPTKTKVMIDDQNEPYLQFWYQYTTKHFARFPV
jgi:hypothetical protein